MGAVMYVCQRGCRGQLGHPTTHFYTGEDGFKKPRRHAPEGVRRFYEDVARAGGGIDKLTGHMLHELYGQIMETLIDVAEESPEEARTLAAQVQATVYAGMPSWVPEAHMKRLTKAAELLALARTPLRERLH
jgi:hypothetical protein